MNNIEHLNAKYVSLVEMAKTLRAVADKKYFGHNSKSSVKAS